jgi:hypothetical protein
MEKIFDIAKDSEKSWGVIAQGIDGNFEEIDSIVNGGDTEYTDWNIGKAIKTNGGVGGKVDIIPYADNAKCAVIPCLRGDVFVITGKGASTARLWCFTDNEYICTLVASPSLVLTGYELISPNDGYLIVNFQNSYEGVSSLRLVKKSINDSILEKVEVVVLPECDDYTIVEPVNIPDDYSTPNDRNSVNRIQTYYEFLSMFYDSLMSLSNDNYTIKKRTIGADQSNRYELYEYDFVPQKYNRVVLLSAGMNAMETSGEYGLALFMRDVVTPPSDDEGYKYLHDNVRFKVLPVICPWSFDQEFLKYGNYRGVNINRNFNYRNSWDDMISQEGQANYKGEAADSEAETLILKNWIRQNGKSASLWVDCHSDVGGTNSYEGAAICSSNISSLVSVEFSKIVSFYKNNGFSMSLNAYTGTMNTYPKTLYSYDVCGCPAIMIEQWMSNGINYGSDGSTNNDAPCLKFYMLMIRGVVLALLKRNEVSIKIDEVAMRLYQVYLEQVGK